MRRSLAVSIALLAACGARTELEVVRSDAGPDARPSICLRDSDCPDGIDCTDDRCVRGSCVHEPDARRCPDRGFCAGPAVCDPIRACVYEQPPCAPRLACVETTCSEARRQCVENARDDRCPVSQRCDLVRGCVARALVHDNRGLYEVDLPDGRVHYIAPTAIGLTDLALHPDGRVFAITETDLFALDDETGELTPIGRPPLPLVALEVGPDGALYGAGPERILRLDPRDARGEPVATLPPGWQASGDIAFVEGRMLVTAVDEAGLAAGGSDTLFEVPLDGGQARPVGSLGVRCVWGLAAFGSTLYGFSCAGLLVQIDLETGAARTVASLPNLSAGGAAAR